MFEDPRSHKRRLALVPLTLAIALFTLPASATENECDVKSIANIVKAISILRNIENSINYLALGQTNAIIAVETGIEVHPTKKLTIVFGADPDNSILEVSWSTCARVASATTNKTA
jgi:hypothetical protein